MDFEERRQEEHTIRQILSDDSGETLRQRLDIDPSLSAGSEQGESCRDDIFIIKTSKVCHWITEIRKAN